MANTAKGKATVTANNTVAAATGNTDMAAIVAAVMAAMQAPAVAAPVAKAAAPVAKAAGAAETAATARILGAEWRTTEKAKPYLVVEIALPGAKRTTKFALWP